MPSGKLLIFKSTKTGKIQLIINIILLIIHEYKIFIVTHDNVQINNLIKKIVERVRSDINLYNYIIIIRYYVETLKTEAIFNRFKLIKKQRKTK